MARRLLQTIVPLLVLAAVFFFGGLWLGGHPSGLPSPLRDAFVGGQDARVVGQAIGDVEHDYYRPVKRRALVNASLTGLVASLDDRFSHYLTPAEFQGFDKANSFSGIGVEVTPGRRGTLGPGGLQIVRVFDNSPAGHAGLRVGDHIVAVDGHSLNGLTADRATSLIEGPPGTTVTLTIHRGARSFPVAVTRELVTEPVVASELQTYQGRRYGVIDLSTFSVAGAHSQVADAVRRMRHGGAQGLVLDLRGNGGGLVEEAQLVASLFLHNGVIVTTRGRTQPTQTIYATGNPIAPAIPLVVLVDRGTASASEIVTAALQDHHRALVVGTHTFGKGVFQEVRPLANGGALDITVGEYFTPNGRNLGGGGVNEGAGITPDVSVPADRVDTEAGVQAALRTLATQR